MGALARKQEASDQSQDGVAAITIDGRIVLFDTSDWAMDGRSPAVVFRYDGTAGVELPIDDARYFVRGARKGVYGEGDLGGGRFRSMRSCVILGRVISQG